MDKKRLTPVVRRKGAPVEKRSVKIGIIGGSGLYQMEMLKKKRAMAVTTPFGKPSDRLVLGELDNVPVVFLARHGQGHTLLPSDINFRANIFAMKKLGVERILSISAVGSMREEIVPGQVVLPDQFYDLTKGRKGTFFGDGVVAHVSLAHPTCPDLAETVYGASEEAGAVIHQGGTYLCMEGPAFSTRAESEVHRSWGVSVIGMTNATEAKLCREAEICYLTIALATDYDCWRRSEEPVSTAMVMKTLHANVDLAKNILQKTIPKIKTESDCGCRTALRHALFTPVAYIPKPARKKLGPILQKYLS